MTWVANEREEVERAVSTLKEWHVSWSATTSKEKTTSKENKGGLAVIVDEANLMGLRFIVDLMAKENQAQFNGVVCLTGNFTIVASCFCHLMSALLFFTPFQRILRNAIICGKETPFTTNIESALLYLNPLSSLLPQLLQPTRCSLIRQWNSVVRRPPS